MKSKKEASGYCGLQQRYWSSCTWTGLENMNWKMKSWCQWSQNFATDSSAARFLQSSEVPVETDKSGKDVCNMNYSQTWTKGFSGKVEEAFEKRIVV